MRCRYCQKTIGPLRVLRDSEFCSDEHRRKMRVVSARAARVQDEEEPLDTFWPAIRSEQQEIPRKQTGPSSTVLFATVLGLALILGSSGLPWGGDSRPSQRAAEGGSGISGFLRRERAVKFREDFSAGLGQWLSESSRGDGWTQVNGVARPGKLRLWQPTRAMADYQFEFAGEIERKGMGWAYRAGDVRNYYATKIVITQPGPLPRAELVRYAVLNGAAGPKTSLPLPLVIRPDTVYKVQVTVKGQQFSTLVNGQMVDTWSDGRLQRGAVGLFADAGETASIRYASVVSRDSTLGQVLSYFGFWVPAAGATDSAAPLLPSF